MPGLLTGTWRRSEEAENSNGRNSNPRISNQSSTDSNSQGLVSAIDRSLALIRFSPDGTILSANENFLKLMGYQLNEIQGKHHSIFVGPGYAQGASYQEFWAKLRRGEFDSAEYKRIAKSGKEVWIQATYNPIFDRNGNLQEVVKIASDVTARKLEALVYEGQIAAIGKVQAVISFSMDGTILDANDNFLNAMGYTLAEIKGKHHRMFLEPGEAESAGYQQFWSNLRNGRSDARIFKRIGKNGKVVWIQASYNPILDLSGKPFRVVKFATDVTEMVRLRDATGENAETVAAATTELSASIAEINRNMSDSLHATEAILRTTTSSEEAAAKLLGSMQLMETVASLIREISGRVNILALNAAIEAARAGEAGKGFAVVASEVKNLSNQTATATDKIVHEIGAVQSISSQVADSVKETMRGVNLVNQYIQSVAAAMEEQGAAVREISERSSRTSTAIAQIIDTSKS